MRVVWLRRITLTSPQGLVGSQCYHTLSAQVYRRSCLAGMRSTPAPATTSCQNAAGCRST